MITNRKRPPSDSPARETFYFAYGSNMDLARLNERGIHLLAVPKRAILEGYSVKFNKMASADPREGFANIVREEGQ